MERKAFWTLIGIGVAFGITMELMKGAFPGNDKIRNMTDGFEQEIVDDPINLSKARLGRLKGATNTTASLPPRIKSETRIDNPAGQLAQVGGIAPPTNPVSGTITAAKQAKLAKAAVKKKKADEKKKLAKKKKKKKKIDGTELEEGQNEDDESEDKMAEDETEVAARRSSPVSPAAPVAPPNKDNDLKTVEEWKKLVLFTPDEKVTNQLIEAYQLKKISADNFYSIVQEMLKDSRPDMKHQGVRALGQTPSARSFVELTGVVDSEQGVSKIKSQAQYYINTYSELRYVHLLASVLRYPDAPSAWYEAIKRVRISVERNLKPRQPAGEQPTEDQNNSQDPAENPAETTPGTPKTPEQVKQEQDAQKAKQQREQTARQFAVFLSPLKKLIDHLKSDKSESRDLADNANALLADLETFLPPTSPNFRIDAIDHSKNP